MFTLFVPTERDAAIRTGFVTGIAEQADAYLFGDDASLEGSLTAAPATRDREDFLV